MSPIRERIASLRKILRERGLTHYLVPSADEHLNEYLPPWRKRREWITGFTGSAGDALVGLEDEETFLFTDGRYHLQAERELKGTGIRLEKVGAPGALTLSQRLERLARERGAGLVVGYDPAVLALAVQERLERKLARHGARFEAVAGNLVDILWNDRPEPPVTPLLECPHEWTGGEPAERIALVRERLAESGAEAITVCKLDQIAWLLGLRSFDDVPFNPVFESFLWLDAQTAALFLRSPEKRLPEGFADRVPGLEALPYEEFVRFLERREGLAVCLDPDRTTAAVARALAGCTAVRALSPIEQAKACKNPAERERMRHANRMASLAKVRALLWLEREIAAGRTVTERGFADRIEREYASLPGFRALSFATIAATGEHGAVIHYSGADETPLRPGELFLIDSGIHLDGGTTDDTRTVAIGEPTYEQRRVFTLVLLGHVRAASLRFPEGTCGEQIDALARSPLWRAGLDYDHGTGHGVGAFLNVHEGPFALAQPGRRAGTSHPLAPGMITSIEPGYYEPSLGGVRLENLYLVEEAGEDALGRNTYRFKPLTFVPFDRRLIERSMLDDEARAWIDAYHERVAREIGCWLDPPERERLLAWTAPL